MFYHRLNAIGVKRQGQIYLQPVYGLLPKLILVLSTNTADDM